MMFKNHIFVIFCILQSLVVEKTSCMISDFDENVLKNFKMTRFPRNACNTFFCKYYNNTVAPYKAFASDMVITSNLYDLYNYPPRSLYDYFIIIQEAEKKLLDKISFFSYEKEFEKRIEKNQNQMQQELQWKKNHYILCKAAVEKGDMELFYPSALEEYKQEIEKLETQIAKDLKEKVAELETIYQNYKSLYPELQNNFKQKDASVYLKDFFRGILSEYIFNCLKKCNSTVSVDDILSEYSFDFKSMQILYSTNFVCLKKRMNLIYLQSFLKEKKWDTSFNEQFLEMITLKNEIEHSNWYNQKDYSSWDLLLDLDIPVTEILVASITQYELLLTFMRQNNIRFSFLQSKDETIPCLIDLAHHKFKNFIFPWIEITYEKYNLSSVLRNYKDYYFGCNNIQYTILKQELCDVELSKERRNINSINDLLAYVKNMINNLTLYYIKAHYQYIFDWADSKNLKLESDIQAIKLTDENKDAFLPLLIDSIKKNLIEKYQYFKLDPYIKEDILGQQLHNIETISSDSLWEDAEQSFSIAIDAYGSLLLANDYYAYLLRSNISTEKRLGKIIMLNCTFENVVTKITRNLIADILRSTEKVDLSRFYTKENTILSFDLFKALCDEWKKKSMSDQSKEQGLSKHRDATNNNQRNTSTNQMPKVPNVEIQNRISKGNTMKILFFIMLLSYGMSNYFLKVAQ